VNRLQTPELAMSIRAARYHKRFIRTEDPRELRSHTQTSVFYIHHFLIVKQFPIIVRDHNVKPILVLQWIGQCNRLAGPRRKIPVLGRSEVVDSSGDATHKLDVTIYIRIHVSFDQLGLLAARCLNGLKARDSSTSFGNSEDR
jgi:hypothetical protein